MLQDLRTVQCWPLWSRLAVTGVALGAAYLAQIPLERDWPGEPFLLFLLVVIGTTLCFGTRIGLLSVALSTFLSLYFFEPVGSPTLRYASDLEKILVYALLALGCVGGVSYLVNAFIERSDADKKKSTLLRELTHGVANNFAAIAALIHTARESVSVEDSKAKSVLDDAIEQVKVMARVHRRLRASGHDVSLDSKAFIHELCDDLRASMARNRSISIECKADSLALCIDDAVSLGLIINELITNATKHAFPDQRVGRIRVCFEVQNGQSCLSVEDDGVGFDDRRNVGIGEDLVKGLSLQLGGDLRVKSSKAGSTFLLSIPHLNPATERPATTSGSWKLRFGQTGDTRYRTALKRVRAHVKNAATKVRSNILVNGKCREVIEALPAAVYMTDAEGRITFYNEAAAALWGCRPELGDSRFCGSWKLYRPDGTPLPHDECPMAMTLRQKRPIRGMEAIAERPDGTRIPFIPYPTPLFDDTGILTGAVNMLVDVSERKRTEEVLARREAQLAVFVEHAPAAIAVFDREMRYLAASRRFVVDHHLPVGAQLIGRSHYDVFPDVPQRWRDIHARVLAGEELSEEEDQYTRYDGLTEWVRWSMAPWRGANGIIGGALLFAEIITEQVEARRALAESEARFRATFENAAVGVVLVGPDGTFLRVNDSFARMLGYSTQELETKSFQDLTHPDDLETSLSVLKKRLAGEADSYCIEKRYTRKDGGIVWAKFNVGCVRKADGAVDYFISVIEDITERKEAEEKLRKNEQAFRELLGALPAAIFVTDAGGRITYYNQAAVELWGKRPELGKDRWSDLARPYCADGKPAKLSNCPTEIALRRGKSVRGLEAILERPDGTRVPVLPYPTPLRDATGSIVGVVNMTVDITERRQAERTLAERNAQLALAGRAALVGSYVYDVSKRTTQVSEGYATIHGLPEGTTETTISEWRARVHPDDLARAEGLREQAFAERRKEDNAEYRIILSTGEIRWIERRGVISYGEDGRPERVVGVNIDVTERKRAEQTLAERNAQLDLAHKVARVGCYTHDIAGKTMRISRASVVTYGLSQNTMELTTQQWYARVHRDDRQRLRAEHIRAFKERRPELISEFRVVRPGGEVRWIEGRSLITYDPAGRAERMMGIYIDVTERRKTEDHKSLLIAELDHRVKNVLACVAAIAQRTRECSRSPDEFLEGLNSRINSLANTHALLSRSHWLGVSVGELVRSELAFCVKIESLLIDGPKVDLAAEATQPMAMVLHELATNAAKYGALSNGHGRVSVRWQMQSNGGSDSKLVLEWCETGGPPVAAPNAPGYGMSVIRDLIPFELGGAVNYVLASEGVRCRLELPANWLVPGETREPLRT